MITESKIKKVVGKRGADDAAHEFRYMIGVSDENGAPYYDENGERCLRKEGRESVKNISFARLAEAFDVYSPIRASLSEGASAAPVIPQNFPNITGFTSAALGLLEYALIERYQNPEYVFSSMIPTVPVAVMGGTKGIGLANIKDLAEIRKPSAAVKMVDIEQRYVEYPDTDERSLGIEVTYEAVASDLTGDLMRLAGDIGDKLRLSKELRIIDVIIGATNTYKYKGTSYNTYYASTDNQQWTNDSVNALVDWQDINSVLQMFVQMVDPETNLPILINPDALVVSNAQLMTARKIFRDTVVQARTQSQAVVSVGANPVFGLMDPIASPWMRARLKSQLLYTDEQADGVWFVGDFKKAFAYREFHGLVTQNITPDSYSMATRRIVAALTAHERGVAVVQDPRYVVRQRVS